MKLIVTIPAFNEEKSIVEVISSIPRKIRGIKRVEVLVYDDGSKDKTAVMAKKAKADYVFSHKQNLGLAQTFKDALSKALQLGADLIVNTDADNQYDQRQIPALIKPILEGRADLVIGDRQVEKLKHMPLIKKYGNMLGSLIIRLLTGTAVHDASSGFRAFTREVAEKIHIFSQHTYTHEMIIDAHFKNFVVVDVPITFKKRVHGQSRLISEGVFAHILKSAETIVRTVLLYKAFRVLSFIGSLFSLAGLIGVLRFLYFALILANPKGHIQSLVISSILVAIGFNILLLGFVADLISYNRRLIEEELNTKRKSHEVSRIRTI